LLTERPFPWSREVWALLLDRLFGAGARLVMVDLIFNPPNDGDRAFHAALEKYPNLQSKSPEDLLREMRG
jgi:CHASE2 domain-containing sensor protein